MVYFLYPETKGLSLEQVDHIFEGKGHGWSCFTQGVRESLKNRPTQPMPTDPATEQHSDSSQDPKAGEDEKGVSEAREWANDREGRTV